MIQNIYKRINITLLCFIILAGITMVSCKKDEVKNVELYSFGPSPVLRGNDIKFIGQNLNLVTSVVLADDVTVSDITVLNESEISITVPQEASPGKVILNYSGGSLSSKSILAFTEPYEISSISPTETAIRAGDEVTIKGDYLNNIIKVIFQSNAVVESTSFISQSRKEIKLLVPKGAASGKIILEDDEENQLYSSQELIISLPEITSLTPATIKAGQDLTITGENLDLVAQITFQGGSMVDTTSFIEQSTTKIVVTTPENLQDGTLTMLAYSGLEVTSTQSLTAALPSELNIQAESIYKTGLNVQISGTDLDLVSSIQFNGAAEVTDFTLADNTITVAITSDATDGVVTLNTASGKNVATEAIVLVKPEATEITPNPVTAGNAITIVGTNLDLVVSVGFAGDVIVEVSPESESSFSVMVPIEASSGELSLNLSNGTSVTTTSVTIDSPEFCFIPTLPGNETEILAGEVFQFDIINGEVLTEVLINGTSSQFIVQETVLHVMIPSGANGPSELNLISSNGDITYEINVTGSGVTETVVFDGPLALTWGDGGRVFVPETAFEGIPAGSVMKIYFSQTENWGQAQINNGSWTPIPFAELGNDGYMTTDTYNDITVTEQELVLTQDVLDNILSNANGDAIIIQGSDWIINKISIITTAATAETIWEGNVPMGNWAGNVQLSSDLFANAVVGKTISVSITDLDPSSDYWQVALKNGADWSDIQIVDVAPDATFVDFVIDENILNIMQTNGIIFQGAFYTLTKVEIK